MEHWPPDALTDRVASHQSLNLSQFESWREQQADAIIENGQRAREAHKGGTQMAVALLVTRRLLISPGDGLLPGESATDPLWRIPG
jgi:hypothetical protein